MSARNMDAGDIEVRDESIDNVSTIAENNDHRRNQSELHRKFHKVRIVHNGEANRIHTIYLTRERKFKSGWGASTRLLPFG